MTHRPHEIKATHLARKALVYVRQSSEVQVRENRGSTTFQRNLARLAQDWGWSADQVEVIDDDLGTTGAAAEHRGGLRRMVAMISAGDVGAVFVGDDSRLSRAAVVTLGLLDQCVAKQVLLITDHKVLDLADPTGYFHACLGAILAEYDNNNRRQHIRRGRDARVRAGRAVSRPPTGYITGDDGDWLLDPDPDLQNAIRTVFQTFLRVRSCHQSVRQLRDQGFTVPRRRGKRSVVWSRPSVSTMLTILKNPSYHGDYVYRRKIVDRALGRDQAGRPRLRAAKPDEMVVISNHHEPYVSREEWQEIQAILRVMGNTYQRTNLGPGLGLLQGIVRCALHSDCRMQVNYRRPQVGGVRHHYYGCLGDNPYGGRLCGGVPGRAVDREIVAAVLDRIAPPRIQAIVAAWKAAQEHRESADGLAAAQLRRARRRADELERRYMLVDPANRLVHRR